jgi:hypothetical protein
VKTSTSLERAAGQTAPAGPEAELLSQSDTKSRRIFYPWDTLLPAAIAFWALGLNQAKVTHLGQFGLPAALPVVFYIGIVLVVLSAGWALAQTKLSPVRLTANLGILILMLYGTAPIVYAAPRYAWLYKYIGVVQYINLHGHLNQSVDIYQNWPGFFAFTAWFDKIVGVQSPLAYAKWAQLAFELLTAVMLHYVFRALPMTERERWLALFLYIGSIWIAQDYLSAQALGVVLSAGVFALTLNFLRRDVQAKIVLWARKRLQPISKRVRRRPASPADEFGDLDLEKKSNAQEAAVLVAIAFVYGVLTFEHELSPYVVLVQLSALAIIGEVRRRWMAILFAVVAIGYFAPHFDFVNKHFGLVASIGNFFGNVAPPSATLGAATAGVRVAEQASHLLSGMMWGLSAIGALRRWRDGRPTLALVILAYSPVFVFFAGAYGNETLLRVFLFSLPWTSCLAAAAIKPVSFSRAKDESGILRKLSVLRAPLALGVAVALFFPAFFGNDSSNVMTPGEVQGVLKLYQTARPGTIFAAADNFPEDIGGRYNLFGEQLLYGTGGLLQSKKELVTSNAGRITRTIRSKAIPNEPAYVLITPAMLQFGLAYGYFGTHDLEALTTTLNHAKGWSRIYDADGVTVFELPPT